MQQCLSPRALSTSLRGVIRSLGHTGRETLSARYPSPTIWRSYSVQTETQRLESAAWLDAARGVEQVDGWKKPKKKQRQVEAPPDDFDFILDGYEAVIEAPKQSVVPYSPHGQPSPPKQASKTQRVPADSRAPSTQKQLAPRLRRPASKRQAKVAVRTAAARSRTSTVKPQTGVNANAGAVPSRSLSRPALRRQRVAVAPILDTPEARRNYALKQVLRAQVRLRLPPALGRSKEVLLQPSQPSMDLLSKVWHVNYARVSAPYDTTLKASKANSVPLLDVHTAEWLENIIWHIEAGSPFNLDALAEFHDVDKKVIWSNCALWLMAHQPDVLIGFLQRTCSDSKIPSSWIADSLTLAALQTLATSPERPVEPFSALGEAFIAFAGRGSDERIALGGPLVRHLMHYCNHERLPAIYEALKTGNFRVPSNTYLHAAMRLARSDHFHQGLDALLEACHAGARVNRVAFKSVCTTLFRQSMQQPGGLRVCLRMVDNLVKVGLRLTTRLCNSLILNAIEAGDTKTALSIYKSLVTHSQEPDVYTYALLLKGCKQNISDVETLNAVVQSAVTNPNVTMNSVLGFEILHCLVLHHTEHNTGNAWPIICQAYRQFFDTAPLEELGLPLPESPDAPLSSTEPMPAPVQAISTMLSAYLQLHSRRHAPAENAHALYKAYLTFYQDRIPPFSAMAHETFMANAFLQAFTMSKRTLIHGAEMIKDMQRAAAHSPPIGTAPTVQTWSIFLRGFTYHGQTKLAEQVLTYMKSKGMQPSNITWNTLAQGYAHDQDVDGLIDTVDRAERSGWAWDEWTSRGLRKLRPRQLRHFEQRFAASRRPKIDFTDDLKAGLEERLSHAGDNGVDPAVARAERDDFDNTYYDPGRVYDAGDVDSAGPGAVMGDH